MDEEEELENTLIGQQEEAPAMDTGDALMGAGQPMFTADPNVVAAVPGIENIRNPGAFNPANVEPVEPVGPPATIGESIRQTYDESVLADLIGRGFGQEAFQSQAPDGTPTFSIFNKRFGTLGSQVPYSEASPEAKAQAINFMLETGGQERPLPETPTSPVRTPEQVQSILNEQRATESVQSPTATAQSFFGQAPASNAAEAAQRLIDAGPAFTQGQAPALDPTSDEAILARRAGRESQFDPRGPNAPMGRDATRAALGGLTLNEYLNAPAGTPGVSGLRTDPQGRMISSPAPAVVNNFAPQTPSVRATPAPFPNTGGGEVSDMLFRGPSQAVPLNTGPGGPPAAFSTGPGGPPPAFSTGPITRPLPNDPRGFGTRPLPNDPASTRPGDVRDMFNRNLAPNLSDFERESLAREARLDARTDFGEAVSDRERRAARGEGLSQADARDLAQGTDPNASEGQRMRALEIQSRLGLGQFKPEKELTDLEKREIESRIRARDAQIKTAQVEQNRPEFAGKVYTVNGVTFAQTSRGGAQVIDTGSETPEQSTAQIQNFEFTLDQIDKAREAYSAGDVARANDILTAAGIQKNGIDVTANEYFGDLDPQVTPPVPTTQATDTGFTQQQEANIQKVLAANPNSTRADVVGAMEKAGKL